MKRLLQWVCYGIGASALALGIAMVLAGKFTLGLKSLVIAVFIFAPVGFYFQALSNRKRTDVTVEHGD